MKQKIKELITKYENGMKIHQRCMDSPKSDNITKNRASYLLNLCEVVVSDLKQVLKTCDCGAGFTPLELFEFVFAG